MRSCCVRALPVSIAESVLNLRVVPAVPWKIVCLQFSEASTHVNFAPMRSAGGPPEISSASLPETLSEWSGESMRALADTRVSKNFFARYVMFCVVQNLRFAMLGLSLAGGGRESPCM